MIRWLVRLSANNSVLVNIIFWVICIAGIFAWNLLPKEQFPKVQVDRIAAIVIYPGASAESVETAIIRPVEEAIRSVDGIKHYYSDATEGRALFNVELTRDTDIDTARSDIERAINEVENLPDSILPPRVLVINVSVPIIRVAIMGDTKAIDYAEKISLALQDFQGVSEVSLKGAAEKVIRIETHPNKLDALKMTHGEIQAAIQAASGAAPAGNIKIGEQSVLVRTPNALQNIDDIKKISLPKTDRGPPIYLEDIADIYEDWEQPYYRYRLDGQPAIVLTLLRTDDADALKTVKMVQEWEKTVTPPQGLTIKSFDDSAIVVKDRLAILAANAGIGIILVGLCLMAFIGLRSTMLVIWGMPVAYLGAILTMLLTDTSINVVSTFALLLVTGIIVDDAVIIVENVQRHIEMGKSKVQAAIDGTQQVFGAVFASTLTTCLAFAPLLLLEGTVGRVMSIVPTVVICSLLMSLIEAFFILPGHLSHYAKGGENGPNAEQKDSLLTERLKSFFHPILIRIVGPRARYATAAIMTVVVLASLSLSSLMRTSLTTEGHPYFVFVNIDLPEGSDRNQTEKVLKALEAEVVTHGSELTEWIYTKVGRQLDPADFSTEGPRYGQLKIGFRSDQAVFDAVPDLLDTLREGIDNHPSIQDFSIVIPKGGPPAGRDIDIKVRSRQPSEILPVAQALQSHLDSKPGVSDIRLESGLGGWEYLIQVDPDRAATSGIPSGLIAQAARQAIDGQSALELTLGERNTKLLIREKGLSERASSAEIRQVRVGYSSAGEPIFLQDLAQLQRKRSIERIQRVDGQRAMRLSALVDPKLSSAESEQADITAAFDKIKEQFPSTELFYGGQLANSKESFAALPAIFTMAILLIFGVLAVQFRSYLQPLIILSAIPLGAAGVVLGLFSVGMDLSFIAMIGAIGLVGIVVNDSLVLIDFINQLRREGTPLVEAVIQGTLLRLRPIFITSITTVLGLAPLGLGIAGEEPLLAPMAIAISFGLAFATILALFIVPTAYLIVEDIRQLTQSGSQEEAV